MSAGISVHYEMEAAANSLPINEYSQLIFDKWYMMSLRCASQTTEKTDVPTGQP